jgi:hypothetical protein
MNLAVTGQQWFFLNIGDLGDGNAGDIAILERFDLARKGKPTTNYLDWAWQQMLKDKKDAAATPPPTHLPELKKRIQKIDALMTKLGKHPQGRVIGKKHVALAAPIVMEMPLPSDARHLTFYARLDRDGPEFDKSSIQWTLSTAPRDVTQIMPGVLTVWKRNTETSGKTMKDFSRLRSAFPDMFERRLEEVADNLYRSKPGIGVYYLSTPQLSQLLSKKDRKTLEAMNQDWGFVSPAQLNTEQNKHFHSCVLRHLQSFTTRAWRRPLAKEEVQALDRLYLESVAKGMDHESSAREVIVRALVSPHFLFKAESLPAAEASGEVALTAHELAARLSYFLWASMPDYELRLHADDGRLLQPEGMTKQVKRMLGDARATGLAEEFAGQWLKFSGFENHDAVDAKLYPQFTPALRAAMLREVTEFFTALIKEDRPITDIVCADYTYLNEPLARHYGIPGVTGPEFRQVQTEQHARGGVLGMGAILTKTSRPHRTSPVLRGDYLYQVVLGYSSPPPPPNVPELKSAEKPASLREALMQHRADQACSVCHDRLDPLGFALEGFDPIGRDRSKGSEPIDATGQLKDGTMLEGFQGLRDYLRQNQAPFVQQFCRKLLGYSLGRQVLPTDKPLLVRMEEALRKADMRLSAAVMEIVTSRQFTRRKHEAAVAAVE